MIRDKRDREEREGRRVINLEQKKIGPEGRSLAEEDF